MQRKFNDTGLCVSHRHYMVDTSAKIAQIIALVEDGAYFTINRPRQYGKTTTLHLLSQELNQRAEYLALNISFEGIGTFTHQDQARFIYAFLDMLMLEFEALDAPDKVIFIRQKTDQITDMVSLSRFITTLIHSLTRYKAVVLLIDEVDKSSNNQLFLDFLGMLRQKYLRRDAGKDSTFHSVILAGVHDIKTLKARIRPDAGSGGGYNSPWNIAADFTVDMSFAPHEIATMLQDYSQERHIQPDIPAIAARLHYYTAGYPYLVSKLCKFIDEDIVSARDAKTWTVADVETAFQMIVNEAYTTTLFDSLAKNLENNPELYELIFQIVINGQRIPFAIANPTVNLGHLYGILVPSTQGQCQIHNRIFEQRIYGYMMSKTLQQQFHDVPSVSGPEFYTATGLNIPVILQRFQTFMQEHYSHRDAKFLEREGRLLFLAYLRPILNGKGFEFKEPSVSDERRMDLVITYQQQRYVIELKRWYGPKAHQHGLQQLSEYLDSYALHTGYLLIYDFRKGKVPHEEHLTFQDKQIFAVWI